MELGTQFQPRSHPALHFSCWLCLTTIRVVRAAQAYKAFARAHGLSGEDFQILGVEGDVTGFEWMSQHFLNNDMAPPRVLSLLYRLHFIRTGSRSSKFC